MSVVERISKRHLLKFQFVQIAQTNLDLAFVQGYFFVWFGFNVLFQVIWSIWLQITY